MNDEDEMQKGEMLVDIAGLSFTADQVEEVGLVKVFSKTPYGKAPDAYAVNWSEWKKGSEGQKLEAETEAQVYKVKKFQRFPSYEAARVFFLGKVDEISRKYKEPGGIEK
jgi:hypothetical protein